MSRTRARPSPGQLTAEQLERVRSRVSAYVYGNVLVLAAVVGTLVAVVKVVLTH